MYYSKETLLEDLDNMEDAMSKTADRCDIWQDRIIYALCKAVYHLLVLKIKEYK